MSKTGKDTVQDLSGLKLGSSVATRQLKYSLLAAMLLGFVITAFQIFTDYQWLEGVYQQANERVVDSSLPVAAEAVTKKDAALAEVMARGFKMKTTRLPMPWEHWSLA